MEVKFMAPQVSAGPESSNNKQDSRSVRLIQYLTRTASGNGVKDPHTHTSQSESRNVSDSEESDEDVLTHAHTIRNSSEAVQPHLLRKLSRKLAKTESSHVGEEKGHVSEGLNGWGMSKSVIEVSKGVAADLKVSIGRLLEMKSMVIEKLASMPTVPAETLEHARHSIESIVSNTTHSAYGKTRDAMVRIQVKLVEIIPSLSPHETKKIVDDVEQEVLDAKATMGDSSQPKKAEGQVGSIGVSTSTASAGVSQQPAPAPAPAHAVNMDRLKAWAFLQSRL